jgi:hypothetical protein
MRTATVRLPAPKWPIFAFVVIALILVFVLDASLRIYPAAVVSGFAGYAGLFSVEAALRSGVAGGARYRPVTRELEPVKFWMTCGALFVIAIAALGFSLFVFGWTILHLMNVPMYLTI